MKILIESKIYSSKIPGHQRKRKKKCFGHLGQKNTKWCKGKKIKLYLEFLTIALCQKNNGVTSLRYLRKEKASKEGYT